MDYSLAEALERTYSTDAHLVAYPIRSPTGEPLARQPHINKGGLQRVLDEGFTVEQSVFFCDVDNPDHAPWTLPLLERALREYEELDVLRTAGVYHTSHGRRIVQPLAAPIPIADVEPYLHRWLLELESAGLTFDRACRDWTRHVRLPHVRRGGQAFRSPWMRLERMAPIALAPIPIGQPTPIAASPRATPPRPALDFKETCPSSGASAPSSSRRSSARTSRRARTTCTSLSVVRFFGAGVRRAPCRSGPRLRKARSTSTSGTGVGQRGQARKEKRAG